MQKNMSFSVRWKSVEGRARGVERMLEHDAYRVDILKQTPAIQGPIEKVNAELLERRMKTYATTAIRSDDDAERERVLVDLGSAFKLSGHLRRIASRHDAIGQIDGALAVVNDDGTRECEGNELRSRA